MKYLHMISFLLVVVGALNWGLVGLFGFNLVNALFATVPILEQLVYVFVGLSGVYQLVTHKDICTICTKK